MESMAPPPDPRGPGGTVTRGALAALCLLLLAAAAQAHWPDVVFRDLTATSVGNDTYLLSVLAVNTEGAINARNASFELGGPAEAMRVCSQYVNLSAFEKQVIECRVQISRPWRYVLAFQSERITFDVGGGLLPVVPSPPPASPSPAPRSPGLEALGAAAALAMAAAFFRRKPR